MNFLKIISNQLNLLHKSFLSKKNYYSFSGVDVIIKSIFSKKKNGIYVDVGCQHPIKNNNTYLLYRKGWSGINVDLDQKNIELFISARPKDFNVNIAISDKVGDADLFFYHDKSPINTINENVKNFQKAQVQKIKKIQTTTLNNVIKESPFKNSQIDFLSIDVEGHELNVLRSFDFLRYKPKVIVVEFLDLTVNNLEIKNLDINKVLNSEIYSLLKDHNYTLVNSIYSDLVFIENNFRD